jgi:hypothetical protein
MPTENTIRKAKAIAITNMVKAGNCSKAYEKLKQAPLAPVNCRTILALEKLHPPLSKPIPRKYTDFYARDNRSYTYFSEEEILTAIKRSTKGSAPGRSGWCAELMLDSWDSCCFRTVVTNLLNWMANGLIIDSSLKNQLLACRLIAISKGPTLEENELPKLRPIAISEIFVKILSSLFLSRIDTQKLLPDLQYGIKKKGGIEEVIHSTNHILNTDPKTVTLAIDFKNAFNSLSRAKIIEAISNNKETRFLTDYFLWSHLHPTPLLLEGRNGQVHKVLKSSEGTRQGDALSTFLFALGWHPLLKSTNDKLKEIQFTAVRPSEEEDPQQDLNDNEWTSQPLTSTSAIIDDTMITGRLGQVKNALRHLLDHAKDYNLDVQLEKCKLLITNPRSQNERELKSFFDEFNIPIVYETMETLGSVIGIVDPNRVHEAFVKKKNSILEHLQELQNLAPVTSLLPGGIQSLLLILRNCVNKTMNYLIRTTPSILSKQLCLELDAKVEQTLSVLLGLDQSLLDDHSKFKIRLPMKEGGAGFTSIVECAEPAFIASSCFAAKTIQKSIEWRETYNSQRQQASKIAPGGALVQLEQALENHNKKTRKRRPSQEPILPTAIEKLIWELTRQKERRKPPAQRELFAEVTQTAKEYYDNLIKKEKTLLSNKGYSNNSEDSRDMSDSDGEASEVNCEENLEGNPPKDPARESKSKPVARADSFSQAKALQAASLSARQPWASSLLTTVPSHPWLCLNSLSIRTFYRLLLGIQPTNHPSLRIPAECACRSSQLCSLQKDLHPHFCRSKDVKAMQYRRHNSPVNSIEQLFKEVGVYTHKELRSNLLSQASNSQNGKQQQRVSISQFRPDLFLHFPSGNKPIIADVVVSCSVAPSYFKKAAGDACHAAKKADQKKKAKYEKLEKEWDAISLPLAFEVHGAFGPSVAQLGSLFSIHVTEKKLNHKFRYEDPYGIFMRALSAALWSANALVVSESTLQHTSQKIVKAMSQN